MKEENLVPQKILFHPSEKWAFVEDNRDLLDIARRLRIHIEQTCNGVGTCGKCQVVVSGPVSPVTPAEKHFLAPEQLRQGVRLACQVIPKGPVEVYIPEVGPLNILSEGLQISVRLKPQVTKEYIELSPPTLSDQGDDLSRLLSALGPQVTVRAAPNFLHQLSHTLRESRWKATVVKSGREVLAVEPGDTRQSLYGVAFDIGTTTVVAYLRDLNTGGLVEIASMVNPQTAYGADIITRINHTLVSPQGSLELRKAVVHCLNQLITEVCDLAGLSPTQIYEATIAGNTTMLHLLLGLPVESIAKAPYIPVVRRGLTLNAGEVWLKIHPQGRVYLLPHIASYVGADIVADLLVSRLHRRRRLTLLLDFGTNAEIVLGNREGILACSAAAGPCFEGGNISCGMRATRGAISGVHLEGEQLILETIGNAPPVGLCGTGLLDLVALLLKEGLIEETGRLLNPEEVSAVRKGSPAPSGLLRRIVPGDRGNQFFLARSPEGKDLYLTQKDLRELQVAKAAIATGIRLLCERRGVKPEAIEEVLLAGAFGNAIRWKSAVSLGLLSRLPRARYRSIGNAAGVGAQLALLSAPLRQQAERIARQVEYVELSATPEFTEVFMEEMYFPVRGWSQ